MMALQEHSLYEEPNGYEKLHARMSGNDGNMFLNLDVKEEKKEAILTTPDVSVFALSTPEVHNLLAATTTNSIIKTPTPTLLPVNTRSLAPATMEQEIYAQGFLDRLEALECRNMNKNVDPIYTMPSSVHQISHYATGSNPSLEAVAPTYVTATLDSIPNFATQTVSQSTASYPVNSSSDNYYPDSSYVMPFRHDTVMPGGYSAILAASGGTLQPVGYSMMDTQLNPDVLREVTSVPDLHTQEQMKVERKKARNRIAASKCRMRRLQRESDLHIKVRHLREHNKELNNEVNGLKNQISNLKKALVQHMKTGCHMDVPMNFNSRMDSQSSPSE